MPFVDIFSSPIAIASFSAWFLAQVLKVPIEFLRTKKWNWGLLASAGGMPSSHSALMTAVTVSIGHYIGFDSPVFILSLAIAGIVIYDATGVRRQSGLQAERINLIIKKVIENKVWPVEDINDLREVIGHSPGEALGGVLFGIAVSVIVWQLMPLG